jgi:hypothetical protein
MAAIAAASGVRIVNDSAIVLRFKAAATTITAGEAVYLSAADTVAIADKDAFASACAIGVALQTATVADDYIDVCVFGPVTGYALTAGADVWVHDDGALTETFDGSDNTANGDLAAGDFACRVGIAINTTTLLVNPTIPYIALAA